MKSGSETVVEMPCEFKENRKLESSGVSIIDSSSHALVDSGQESDSFNVVSSEKAGDRSPASTLKTAQSLCV